MTEWFNFEECQECGGELEPAITKDNTHFDFCLSCNWTEIDNCNPSEDMWR